MWVLHVSYVEACVAAKTLLPESAYEWGNPDNPFLEGLSGVDERIARAAAKSRAARARGRPPVFRYGHYRVKK